MDEVKHENARKGKPTVEPPAPEPSSAGSESLGLLAEVTTLAWNLVIPIVGGVMLGHYLDGKLGSEVTWTLSLLVLGVMIAFSNLYNLYIEHGRRHVSNAQKQRPETKENHDQEI